MVEGHLAHPYGKSTDTDRDKLEAALLTHAHMLYDDKISLPITWEDKKTGYVVRSKWEDDAPLTMSEQCFDTSEVSADFF
jgi:hypothetical protein